MTENIHQYVSILQHQQQVAAAVERAKQVTMTELNAIIGVRTPTSLAVRYSSSTQTYTGGGENLSQLVCVATCTCYSWPRVV